MPRGKRKLGAYSITLWLADGCRLELYSSPNCPVLTDAELAASIKKQLLPVLDKLESKSVDKP